MSGTLPPSLQYRVGAHWTPELTYLLPFANVAGSHVTVRGTFRASRFDTADVDPATDGDDTFSRILIGGRGCSNQRDNGTL